MLRATTDAPTPTELACTAALADLRSLYAEMFAIGQRHQRCLAQLALTENVAQALLDTANEAAHQHACRLVRMRAQELLSRRLADIRLEHFVDDDPAILDSTWSTTSQVIHIHWDYGRTGTTPGDPEALVFSTEFQNEEGR